MSGASTEKLTRNDVAALTADRLLACVPTLAAANGKPEGSDALSELEAYRETLLQAFRGLEQDPASVAWGELRQQREALATQEAELRKTLPTTMIMRERKKRRTTYMLQRGRYDMPDRDQPVTAEVPACLPPMDDTLPRNRLGLARWLVAPDHPLTARVFVNRIWEQMFGLGIVKSSENFGLRGDRPSHPDLLDWLAVDFVESGWDVHHLIRRIVTSQTYRRSSSAPPADYRADPENRWLARGPRFRLPAEMVRDNALAISGLLSPKIGGPSVKPYQPDGLWDELAGGASGGPYELAKGEDLYRRSLYTFRKRTVPHPTMTTFDAPSFEICTVARSTTNTPLQALALLNDETYVEAARQLAERMLFEGGDEDPQRIRYGFRRCTSRFPRPEELDILQQGLDTFRQQYADPQAAKALLAHGRAPLRETADRREWAAFTALASTLLNLDETITKE